MSTQPYLTISGVIFALVAIVHLVRALSGWDFVIGDWEVPMWGSWLGFLLPGALSVWAYRLRSS